MTLTCHQASEMATDRAEGALDEVARVAFDEHIRGCDGCRAYVRQLELARRALGRLPEPEVSTRLHGAALAGFDAWAAAQGPPAATEGARARRFPAWPVLGTLGTVALLVAFARQRSASPGDWVVGAGLAVAALAVASLAGRFAMGTVAAAVGAAAAAALAGGAPGGLEVATGIECLGVELVSAAVVAGAGWLAARGGARTSVRTSLAAGGVAGALAADAALQLTCEAQGALPHLLAFHLGGVVVVAVAALAVLGSVRVPSRR